MVKENAAIERRLSLVGIIIALISLLVSVISIFQAIGANRIAKESNQLAQKAVTPQITVKYLYPFADYRDYVKNPCKDSQGRGLWEIEYAPVFDITNTGGISNSITDMDFLFDMNTNNPDISAEAYYVFFESESIFQEWFNSRNFSPLAFKTNQSMENITAGGPPITIEPGETTRFVIRGYVTVRTDSKLTPEQVYQSLYGTLWTSNISFSFGDGTISEVSVFVPRTYYGVPGAVAVYEKCP